MPSMLTEFPLLVSPEREEMGPSQRSWRITTNLNNPEHEGARWTRLHKSILRIFGATPRPLS